jgi:hypothetical protein
LNDLPSGARLFEAGEESCFAIFTGFDVDDHTYDVKRNS